MAFLPYSIRSGYYDDDGKFQYYVETDEDTTPVSRPINEEKYTSPYQTENHLKVTLIDPDKLVKANDLKEVTNPVAFVRKGVPAPDGLWSNEIFGITQYQRANTFAYIDLGESFINPLIYKLWCKVDSEVKSCVHGLKTYKIDHHGALVEDENGFNGISFLKANISKYKFRRTDSNKRDMNIDFISSYIGKPEFFITKYIVIPPYYRDINTDQGKVTIDQINALYRSLLIAIKALKESSEYGLTLSAANRGRIQELLVQIYDWFGSGTTIGSDSISGQIPGKFGILRRSVMSKTTDYASRLVLSAPQLKVESVEDIEADLDYCVAPLASILANFYPFIIFHARRILENEFSADSVLPYIDKKTGEVQYLHPKDYQTEFSDERIRKEIERFLTGFSNRFIPIDVPTMEGPVVRMKFKGYNTTPEEYERDPSKHVMDRSFTWCDLFYISAVEAVKDKCVLITRYPIDSYFNQFPARVKVSSTLETEPMVLDTAGNKYYPRYPKIREKDFGTDTSNKFIDTLNLSNLFLDGIGGDYDGDQVTLKGIYSEEANRELMKIIDSRKNLLGLDAKGVRESGKEAILAMYSLTKILDNDQSKLTDPVF